MRTKKHRNRPSFVCTNCRHRKIKCDKGNPCKHCICLGIGDTCQYVVPDLSHLLMPQGETTPEAELQSEMDTLKRHLSELESKVRRYRANRTDQGASILDLKFPKFKKTTLQVGSEHQRFFGGMSGNPMTGNSRYSDFRDSLKGFLENETENWRHLHPVEVDTVELLYTKSSEKDVLEEASELLLPNVSAYIERFKYVEKHREFLSFLGFVSMPLIYRSLDQVVNDLGSGPRLKQQLSLVDFAKLAMMFSLVKFVEMLTAHDDLTNFQHSLDEDHNKRLIVGVKLLRLSRYSQYPSIYSLYALLMTRLNRFMFETDEIHRSGGYHSCSLFHAALDMSWQLGVHRNQQLVDIDMMSNDSFLPSNIELWSHIRLLDALYSCDMGGPLMISGKFSDTPSGVEWREKIIQIYRKVAFAVTSVTPVSIRELVELLDELMDVASLSETFSVLLRKKGEGEDLAANHLYQKLRLLETYQRLCLYIKQTVEDISFLDGEDEWKKLDDKDVLELAHLDQKLTNRATSCSLMFLALIHELCNGDTVAGTRYIGAIKPTLTRILRNCCGNLVGCFFIRNTKLKKLVMRPCNTRKLANDEALGQWFLKAGSNNVPTKFIKCDISAIDELEPSIYTGINEMDLTDKASQLLHTLIWDPHKIIGFFSDFYRGVIKDSLMATSYAFFIKFKYLLMICYLLQTLVEAKLAPHDLDLRSSAWHRVIEETRNRMEQSLNLGDSREWLQTNGDHISNFIDCVNSNPKVWDLWSSKNTFLENKSDLFVPWFLVNDTLPDLAEEDTSNYETQSTVSSHSVRTVPLPLTETYQVFF